MTAFISTNVHETFMTESLACPNDSPLSLYVIFFLRVNMNVLGIIKVIRYIKDVNNYLIKQ